MTLPKNASDPNQHPQRAAAIAISIAATTFVVHPLHSEIISNFCLINESMNQLIKAVYFE